MKGETAKPTKVALVVTYLGNFPSYFDYFIKTCAENQGVDFLFFCDSAYLAKQPLKNVKFFDLSLQKFNALASEKLGVQVLLIDGYKLCDLKPMYGKIYEDYLNEYEFWGFCDIDMIFGDISKVVLEKLDKYDVISSHSQYLSGPFSLFRNTEEVNTLYSKSKDWVRVVTENKVFLFDEASNIMPYLWEGYNIFDYVSEVESMTHILMNKDKCMVRVLFAGFIVERVKDKIAWINGALRDGSSNNIAMFHYIIYKNKLTFTVPAYNDESCFFFDKNGFYLQSVKSKTIDRVTAFVSNFLAKIHIKIKKVL